jgi:hypothetical protein
MINEWIQGSHYFIICFNIPTNANTVSNLAYRHPFHANDDDASVHYLVKVGLDDIYHRSFYFRTDPKKDILDRVRDHGRSRQSISLTTITTMTFGLGYISSIPAVQWLGPYAFVTINGLPISDYTLLHRVHDPRRSRVQQTERYLFLRQGGASGSDRVIQMRRPRQRPSNRKWCQLCKATYEEQPDALRFHETWYADF